MKHWYFTPFFGFLLLMLLLGGCKRRQTEIPKIVSPAGGDGSGWRLNGNSGTSPSTYFIGTTDRQPLVITADTNILFQVHTGNGIWGHFKAVSIFRKGSWVTGLEMSNCDSALGLYSMVAVAKEHVKCIVRDDMGYIGNCKIGSQLFNAGNFDTQGEQYLFLDWGMGRWNIGNTANFSSALVGDTVLKTVTAYADSGLLIKNAIRAGTSGINHSLRMYLARDTARIKSNLPVKIESNVYANNIGSGVYTPQISHPVNVTASKAYACQYMRVGDVITVSGKIDIDAGAASATQLSLKLPIASALVKDYEVSGTGQSVTGQGFAICADATNNTALIKFLAKDINPNSYYYTLTYNIR